MNRREFLKSALTLAALTPMAGFLMRAEEKKALSPATVYFTPEISPESVIRMYHALGTALPGNDRESPSAILCRLWSMRPMKIPCSENPLQDLPFPAKPCLRLDQKYDAKPRCGLLFPTPENRGRYPRTPCFCCGNNTTPTGGLTRTNEA